MPPAQVRKGPSWGWGEGEEEEIKEHPMGPCLAGEGHRGVWGLAWGPRGVSPGMGGGSLCSGGCLEQVGTDIGTSGERNPRCGSCSEVLRTLSQAQGRDVAEQLTSARCSSYQGVR